MIISGNITANYADGPQLSPVSPASDGQVSPNRVSQAPDANAVPVFGPYRPPYPPPLAWFKAEEAFRERVLREGVTVTDQMRVIPTTAEERAEHVRYVQAVYARAPLEFSAAASGPPAQENHDTVVPNLEGLSLKWAGVVRGVVQDMVKNPGPGTLYGGYGDKTTHSAVELLGWIDEYIAKLNAEPTKP